LNLFFFFIEYITISKMASHRKSKTARRGRGRGRSARRGRTQRRGRGRGRE
jgi:hypothetical protein